MKKKHVTEEMHAGRFVAKGKIGSLATAFVLPYPGTIMVLEKDKIVDGVIAQQENLGIIINCRLLSDDGLSDMPVIFGQYTEGFIVEIGAGAIDLDAYDVYWGTGGTPTGYSLN